MTVQPSEQLFTVCVAAPSPAKGSWKVVVRASDRDAAAARLESRGHRVLEVRSGSPSRPNASGVLRVMPSCAVCGYPLKDLPPQPTLEVTCPECGTINLGIELPIDDQPFDAQRAKRLVRLFLYGIAAGLFAAVILILAR